LNASKGIHLISMALTYVLHRPWFRRSKRKTQIPR